MHIERALNSFNALIDQNVPAAAAFRDSLLKYTIDSDEGGLWILGYIFTLTGHNDMYSRILRGDLTSKYNELDTANRIPRIEEPVDPIEQTINDIVEDRFFEDLKENSIEDDVNTELLPEEEEEAHEEEVHEKENLANFQTQTDSTPSFSNILTDKAKKSLRHLLSEQGYGKRSIDTMIKRFNWYIDTESPFPNYQVDNIVGFSWSQIGLAFPDFKPIATIALKLLNCGCSEASCERTISSQRLIHTTRRRASEKRTLDARLILMNSSIKNNGC